MTAKILKLKTELSIIALLFAIPFSMHAQYCDIADADEVVVEEITKVDFAGTSISNADSTSALIDKTNTVIEVTAGESYTLTVEGNTYGNFENSMVAFVDWNQNEVLNDQGEVFELGSIINSTGADNLSVSMEITIPEDAVLGETRFRITKIYTDEDSPALVNPCALEMDAFGFLIVPGFGQALDFTLDIQEATADDPIYCTPFLDCEDGDFIANVTFLEIDNTTTCSPDGYGDFTDQIANVQAGGTYPISVSVGDGWMNESVSVWIDFDGSGTFEEDEFFYIGTGSDEALTGNITIPIEVSDGDYRMRVRVAAIGSTTATWDMSCDELQGYGETEDYTVNVSGVAEEACEWTVKVWTYTTYADDIYWELTNEDGILLSGDDYDLMFIDEQNIRSSGPVEFYISTTGTSGDNEVNFSVSNESGELISGHLDPNEEATFSDLLCSDEGTPIDEDEYCQPFLDCTGGDVITNVTFQEIDNDSDCNEENGGYSDFTDMKATVQSGGTYPISVTVGDGWADESVSVWIDFDESGTFDEDEFFYIGTGSDETLTGEITIPLEVNDGDYRMRVRVAAVGESDATWDMSCDTNEQFFGETEDYTLTVDGTLGVEDNNMTNFTFYPNPMQDVLHIQADESIKSITVYDLLGKKVLDMKNVTDNTVGVASLPTGTFVFQIIFDNGSVRNFKAVKR